MEYQVSVTTKDRSNIIIDGPTSSAVYSIIQPSLGPVEVTVNQVICSSDEVAILSKGMFHNM